MSKIVLIGVAILALIVFGTAIYLSLSSQSKKTVPNPVIQQSPSPTTNQSQQSPTTEEQIKTQSAADQDFAQKAKQVQQSYPWYNQLPFQNTDYFVYFNLDSKEFIARLYPKQSASQSIDEQVNNFKAEITSRLTVIGVDVNQYTINWEVNPEP